jgi:hypothetical protein
MVAGSRRRGPLKGSSSTSTPSLRASARWMHRWAIPPRPGGDAVGLPPPTAQGEGAPRRSRPVSRSVCGESDFYIPGDRTPRQKTRFLESYSAALDRSRWSGNPSIRMVPASGVSSPHTWRRGRLATAGGSDQGNDPTRSNIKIDVV